MTIGAGGSAFMIVDEPGSVGVGDAAGGMRSPVGRTETLSGVARPVSGVVGMGGETEGTSGVSTFVCD